MIPPHIRNRVRRTATNFGLICGGLLISFVLAEIAVRIMAPQQLIVIRPDLWQPADTVGWLHRPNVRTHINTGERTVRVYTDAEGFRIGAEGRVTTGRRVLLLGDSFLEALQVEYEQSVAGLLQKLLPDLTGGPVAIRNAGIDDWSPSQYLLRAGMLLPRDGYALVVTFLYVGNDARSERTDHVPPRRPAERHNFRLPQRLAWKEIVDATLRPLNDAMEVRSHLFILLRTSLETLRMRTGLSPLYFPTEFLRREATDPRWTVTADICRDLSDLALTHGARSLFVLIPAPIQVDSGEFTTYVHGFGLDSSAIDLDQPTERLKEELTARGLVVLDALPAFRAAQADGEVLYGRIDPHLTLDGNAELARLVAPVAAHVLAGSR